MIEVYFPCPNYSDLNPIIHINNGRFSTALRTPGLSDLQAALRALDRPGPLNGRLYEWLFVGMPVLKVHGLWHVATIGAIL
jgi:hypothetical protein